MAEKPIRNLLVSLNNRITHWRGVRVPPANLLVLLPRCLQNDACTRAVQREVGECGRCGRCPLAGILALRDRYGVQVKVVGGGRQALQAVKDPAVRAVVAVACVQELLAGVLGALPKPVVAVRNAHPCGPCCNTTVDLAAVEAAIVSLMAGEAHDEHTAP